MPLSDIVNVSIALSTAPISEPGFGVPLILSRSAAWVERVRSYTSLTGVASDFGSTTPEYKAAAAMFSQIPAPAKIMIGRCANKPTQRWTITPTAADSTKYRVVMDGVNIDYTSDGSGTVAEICTGLKAAFDAAAPAGLTATDGTTFFRVTASTPGAWHAVKADESAASKPLGSLMAVLQDHADPGVATDLDAIAVENNDWYAICNLFNSAAEVAAVAGWAESHSKIFLAATQDTVVATQALGVGSDIAQTLKGSADARTSVVYHPDNAAFADAAWLGAKLPSDPGSENWMFATLAGVPAVPLSATHITNLKAKYANGYYTVGGKNITFDGKTSANQYIDVIRGRDWFVARLQTRYFRAMSGANKLPYTDAGIGILSSETWAQMDEGIREGFVASDPKPVVIAGRASAQASNDRASRSYKGLSFSATIQGAIDSLSVSGVLSA